MDPRVPTNLKEQFQIRESHVHGYPATPSSSDVMALNMEIRVPHYNMQPTSSNEVDCRIWFWAKQIQKVGREVFCQSVLACKIWSESTLCGLFSVWVKLRSDGRQFWRLLDPIFGQFHQEKAEIYCGIIGGLLYVVCLWYIENLLSFFKWMDWQIDVNALHQK